MKFCVLFMCACGVGLFDDDTHFRYVFSNPVLCVTVGRLFATLAFSQL